MSVESISLVLNHSKAEGTDKVVLLGIANHDGDGGAWPSLATLARYANKTPRAVRSSLRRLEQLGELETITNAGGTDRTDPRYRTNRYNILINPGGKPTSSLNESREEVQRVSGRKPTSSEPSIEPSIRNTSGFDAFWNLYPRKEGKLNAEKAWKRLTRSDQEAAMAGLPAWSDHWISSHTEMNFIKLPTTWLNGHEWENPRMTKSAPAVGPIVIRACIMCAAPNPRLECNGPSYIGEDFDMAECPWRT